MSDLNYDLDIRMDSAIGRRGDTIGVTAVLTNCSSPVKSVYMSIPEYGFFEVFDKVSDTTFKATGTVPYEAPSTTYSLVFYAKDESGRRGPEIRRRFTVE